MNGTIQINQIEKVKDKQMTLNQIIGNRKTESKIDTNLWKKMNELYPLANHMETVLPNNSTQTNNALNNKLIYNKDNEPTITLSVPIKVIIHTPTQKEYDTLMQVCESGGKYWNGYGLEKIKPTQEANWKIFEKEVCVKIYPQAEIYCCDKAEFMKPLSPNEFYKTQNITQNTIIELNSWYEKNNPDRASKG
jgi:hypothetical protein